MTRSMAINAPHDVRMLEVRRQFFDEGNWNGLSDQHLPHAVLRSWRRCCENGLNYQATGQGDPEGRSHLSEARERSEELLRAASGIMDHLFEQIRSSGSLVVLSDDRGLILHGLGDPGFFSRAQRVALAPGASWNESLRGTNAIGTALVEAAPVEVAGAEHFLDRNGILTCSASPIFGPDGELVGVLDISGEYHSGQRQTHTLGLVRLAAQLLERRLFEERFAGETLIGIHTEADALGAPTAGLLALSTEGAILGANKAARGLLAPVSLEQDFASLFKLPFGAFMDRIDRTATDPVEMETRGGQRVHARLRSAPPKPSGAKAATARQPETPKRPARRNTSSQITLGDLATGDPRLQLALDRAARIAGKDIPLLIQGESGSGKELFARAFHFSGPRKDGPFVAVNCAAIPETLIESELFGYVGGAFTGARREGAIGRIQQAHGGTLFLDEIGDMPLNMQARLLRVLQERCVNPIGAQHQIPVDISLVCATHRVLSEAIQAGTFREDLYYRVNGLTVSLPALRERTDIRAIAALLLHGETDADGRISISEEVLRLIERHPWPGNVRQLQNVIRVAVALLDEDERIIRPHHLPEEMLQAPQAEAYRADVAQPAPSALPRSAPKGRSLEEIQHEAIMAVMNQFGGNISAAARQLGVSRNTLYRRMGRMN